MKGRHMESGAAGCVSCGTEGGYAEPPMVKPCRGRGRCKRCYDMLRRREMQAGKFVATTPIPRPTLPPVGDLDTLIPVPRGFRWRGAWANEEWRRGVAYEVARGEAWLAARQQQEAAA